MPSTLERTSKFAHEKAVKMQLHGGIAQKIKDNSVRDWESFFAAKCGGLPEEQVHEKISLWKSGDVWFFGQEFKDGLQLFAENMNWAPTITKPVKSSTILREEDPDIASGEYEWVVQKQRCGGKGQLIDVRQKKRKNRDE